MALTTGKHGDGDQILRIVKMDSRSNSGNAFGTNKGNNRKEAPFPADKVVKTIDSSVWKHGGGIQVLVTDAIFLCLTLHTLTRYKTLQTLQHSPYLSIYYITYMQVSGLAFVSR